MVHVTEPRSTETGPPRGSTWRGLSFALCGLGALLLTWLARGSGELDPAQLHALFILLFAASLWITGAVPAFSVGILVIGLGIALLGRPDGVFAETASDWERYTGVLGHPLIWLFFGGFVLAAGMSRTGLDRYLARRVLVRFGDRPAGLLLGVVATTFVLSMFLSNTATTAMMLALTAPLVRTLADDDPFERALLVGIALGANVGGMGTLIGSPPNAIAVGALAEIEPATHVTFLQWMLIGLPPGLVLLAVGGLLVSRTYRPALETIDTRSILAGASAPDETTRTQHVVVASTLAATVGLWLTGPWHGIPTAAVSLLPTVAFTVTGVLGTRALRRLPWDVLFLLAGGLALGQIVTDTGLSGWIVAQLPAEGLGELGLGLILGYATVLLSNVMSNTATANVLIPVAVSIPFASAPKLALSIALCASAAMALTIATPPNAMVSAEGRVGRSDFLRLGLVMGIVAPPVIVAWVHWVLGPLLF